ncbi:hypothetical protein FSP39_023119 [Pinctada imbricata]|uniref:Uncharacterized protein n=1 Tax=Pinctada imbricata TaxID=66713 RepID=A0AA88XXI7_PINIB|nr:hypothetical protein FSP39_023119 [Pinctada imbricata]
MRCNRYRLFVFVQIFVCASCTTVDEIDRLSGTLLTGYNKYTRPPYDNKETLYVYVTFGLISINYYDDVTGTLSIVGGPSFTWNDYRLGWNPADYSNLTTLILPRPVIWYPEIYVINPAGKMDAFAKGQPLVARIYPNGDVILTSGDQINVICPSDMEYFPFDRQTCRIRLAIWNYEANEVFLKSLHHEADIEYYSKNNLWDLESTSCKDLSMGNFDGLFVAEMTMKRKSLFLCISMFAPFMVLALLNPLVFILPQESGERISFAVTILLSFMVFMTLLTEALPRSSTPVASVSYYLLTFILYSSCIITSVIITSKVYWLGNTDDQIRKYERIANILSLSILRSCSQCKKKGCVAEAAVHESSMNEKSIIYRRNPHDLAHRLDNIAFTYSMLFLLIVFIAFLIQMNT